MGRRATHLQGPGGTACSYGLTTHPCYYSTAYCFPSTPSSSLLPKVVFIGRDLDHALLREHWQKCIFTGEASDGADGMFLQRGGGAAAMNAALQEVREHASPPRDCEPSVIGSHSP